jgi:hypothetical protein
VDFASVSPFSPKSVNCQSLPKNPKDPKKRTQEKVMGRIVKRNLRNSGWRTN